MQAIVEPIQPTISKSLRLRLSPKTIKMVNKFSTSVDENQHRLINGQRSGSDGIESMSRIKHDKHQTDIHQTTSFLSSKVSFID